MTVNGLKLNSVDFYKWVIGLFYPGILIMAFFDIYHFGGSPLMDWSKSIYLGSLIMGSIFLVLLCIFYCIWLYQFHVDLRKIDSTYGISPGGAIACFFIPFYNLWGIWHLHNTYCRLLQSKGDLLKERGRRLKVIVIILYILFLFSNIPGTVASILDNYSEPVLRTISHVLNFADIIINVGFYLSILIAVRAMHNSLLELTVNRNEKDFEIEVDGIGQASDIRI